MGMTCRECGHENRLAASFCGNCAQPLAGDVKCPACASDNPWPQNYCNACGASLSCVERSSRVPPVIQEASNPSQVAVDTGVHVSSRGPVSNLSMAEGAYDADSGPDWLFNTQSSLLAVTTVVLLGILLAVTRIWDLGSTPAGLFSGELELIRVTQEITAEGWIGLSHNLLAGSLTGYSYLLALWTTIVGDEIGMVRLLSGIASIASVGVTYLLANTLFNRRVALFSAMLMAVGLWPITYARLALPTSMLLLFEVTALYLLTRACRESMEESRRTRFLAASGALVGLGLYVDWAAIVLLGAALCLWLREYLSDAASTRIIGRQFATFAIAALIVSLPFWAALATDDHLSGAAKALLVTETPSHVQDDGVMGQLRTVTGNVVNTGRAFVWSASADEFGRGGGRIVDPLTGLLVLIGLLVCIRKWREYPHGVLLVLLIVTVLGVGLTKQEGMFSRLIIAAPAAFILAGFAVDWLLSWLKGRVPIAGIVTLMGAVAIVVATINLTTYYGNPIGPDPSSWTGASLEHPALPAAIASRVP